jgi:hypothetical protein
MPSMHRGSAFQEAIAVYTSDELDIDEGSGGGNNVPLKNWLVEGKKQLDAAREALRYLCDCVAALAMFVRAYADITLNLSEAGYPETEVRQLQNEVEFYIEIRPAIKRHSGEELDIKPYEADMRLLLNWQFTPTGDKWKLYQAARGGRYRLLQPFHSSSQTVHSTWTKSESETKLVRLRIVFGRARYKPERK